MTAPERARLERDRRVRRIYDDGLARVAGPTMRYGLPHARRVHQALHTQGRKGRSVTVAVLDTGFWKHSNLIDDSSSQFRVKAQYDVIRHRFRAQLLRDRDYQQDVLDASGHGTHVTAVILSRATNQGRYNGIAPDARLVVVKAFNPKGSGTYADVIRGDRLGGRQRRTPTASAC